METRPSIAETVRAKMVPLRDPRLRGIGIKIERAVKHILDLEAAINAFHKTKPYGFVADRNPETGVVTYRVGEVRDIPLEIPAIAGDAVHCLRCALDQLAFILWDKCGRQGKESRVFFPISGDAANYKADISVKINGATPDIISALKTVQAYKGGNGHDLWVVGTLDNIDKHRSLLTALASFRSADIGPTLIRQIIRKAGPNAGGISGIDPNQVELLVAPNAPAVPLKVGNVLLRIITDKIDENMKLPVEIAFNEPGVIEGESILAALPKLVNVVSNIVTELSKLI